MIQMRVLVIMSLASLIAFAQPTAVKVQFPIGCTMPVLLAKNTKTTGGPDVNPEIQPRDFVASAMADNGLLTILDAGQADTDIILDSFGSSGNRTGSSKPDSFFLDVPSGAYSTLLNIRLPDDLAYWKWKPATCPGSLLRMILPRQATLVIERQPNGQNIEIEMRPNAQYPVAILLHIHYSFKKIENQHYVVTSDVSLPRCKEMALQPFEFRGLNGAIEFPGPTLSCKGQPVYVYHPTRTPATAVPIN